VPRPLVEPPLVLLRPLLVDRHPPPVRRLQVVPRAQPVEPHLLQALLRPPRPVPLLRLPRHRRRPCRPSSH
jgi:hypothetical protein